MLMCYVCVSALSTYMDGCYTREETISKYIFFPEMRVAAKYCADHCYT